jgi:hypothetical protein
VEYAKPDGTLEVEQLMAPVGDREGRVDGTGMNERDVKQCYCVLDTAVHAVIHNPRVRKRWAARAYWRTESFACIRCAVGSHAKQLPRHAGQ